jgi:Zn-dependent peptidase ImmA (M78 family)
MDDDHSAAGVLGRWRATLAHEAAHVIMHRVLFELSPCAEELFAGGSAPASARLMRCLKRNVLFRGGGSDWREVQANKGMAALLMPRDVFIAIVQRALVSAGVAGNAVSRDVGTTKRIVADVAAAMNTSKQATEIRLETLGIVSPNGQRVLL